MALKLMYVGILLVICVNVERSISAITQAKQSKTPKSSFVLENDTSPPVTISVSRLACLSGEGMVLMKSGLLKPVAELKSGDLVVAVNIATNKIVESEILMIAHASSDTLSMQIY
jgi:hypothetical protein